MLAFLLWKIHDFQLSALFLYLWIDALLSHYSGDLREVIALTAIDLHFAMKLFYPEAVNPAAIWAWPVPLALRRLFKV